MTTNQLKQLQSDMEEREIRAANTIVVAGCLIMIFVLISLLVRL